ncbi:MAG: sporulation protein YtfJ [Clostridiales bacterium]|nr:sporulation protein YtfJ [Clostridiales bacterium]
MEEVNMSQPINEIMKTTMENLKQMIDVGTVIGAPIASQDGTTIIPVSRVSFGFVSGGGEYKLTTDKKGSHTVQEDTSLPFAGGAGAGISVAPTGFLVVGGGSVHMLSACPPSNVEKIIDAVPGFINEVKKAASEVKNMMTDNDDPADGDLPTPGEEDSFAL